MTPYDKASVGCFYYASFGMKVLALRSTREFKRGFPHSSVGVESACNAGDLGLIPGSRRSPGKGNGNPLQYSCLGNPMDRGVWQATVRRVIKSQTHLSDKETTC